MDRFSKHRVTVSLSLREVEALMAALAIGVLEIRAEELLTARAMIALDRGVSKIEDAEKKLRKLHENG